MRSKGPPPGKPRAPDERGEPSRLAAPRRPAGDIDSVTEAVLTASRVLVAVAARSLGASEDDITLAQYRVLVILASRGPQRVADLAEALGVNPSTATRLVERLVRRRLVRRHRSSEDRREVRVRLSEPGRELVDAVTVRRRRDIARLIAAVPVSERERLVSSLSALSAAAGEVPDPDWALGWA